MGKTRYRERLGRMAVEKKYIISHWIRLGEGEEWYVDSNKSGNDEVR